MNREDLDPGTAGHKTLDFGRRKHRGWWPRNRLWFVPALLLAVVVLGGGALYWWFFARVYSLEAYRSAMQKIAADPELRAEIGEPIRAVRWPPPSPRLEEGETDIRWRIEGPKGHAKAHLKARLMVGKWETVILEAVLDDERKIAIRDASDTEAEAPRFEAPKTESPKTETNAPGPEINLPIPPDEGPGKT